MTLAGRVETKSVPLGDIADLKAGFGFPKIYQGKTTGDYPFAKVGDISRAGRSGTHALHRADHYVDESDLKLMRASTVPAGSVLFAKIGEAIRQEHRVVAECALAIDNNAMAAVPGPLVESRYLFRFLQTVNLYVMASSTTVPSLRKSQLSQIQVPLPSLPEQHRIAAILDKADHLRTQRREALAHLDALTRSIFNYMFELDVNVSTEMHDLGDVCDFYAGSSLRGGESWADQDHGFLQLKVSDMNREGNEVQIRSAAYWSESPGAKSATLPAGSIIFPKRGASIATNKKRTVMRPAILDPNLMGITPKASLDIQYLYHWFEQFDLTSLSSGSSVPQLNKKDLSPVHIAVPPLELQQTFARRVASVERLKQQHRTQLAALDTLFASLQHRAFKGKL